MTPSWIRANTLTAAPNPIQCLPNVRVEDRMNNPLFQPASRWPLRGEYDVVVVGAGPGGLGAAIAASRLGMRTLIIERYGFPGGTPTTANIIHLMGFALGGRQIAGGVADELVRELDRMGLARLVRMPGHTGPAPIGDRPLQGDVIVSVEGLRVAANRMLARAGVERLYYTSVIGALVEDNAITAVAVDNADGPGLLRAKTFVDASGDAHLVWRAGGEVREAPVEDAMTKTIVITVGGVKDFCHQRVSERFRRLVNEGRVPFPNQDRFMGYATLNPGEVGLNFTLVAGNALSAAEMTRMDIELREQVLVTVEWFRQHFPEFADCYLVDSAVSVGVRAGRSIVGLETITCRDLDEGTPVAEPVALGRRSYGGHALRSFHAAWSRNNPGVRGIPRKALIPVRLRNAAAAGRAISAEPRAISSFRLISQCVTIGQGAGVLAALAARSGEDVADVPYTSVRDALVEQNAILE